MKWFQHDVQMTTTPPMQALMKEHGLEGLAVYWEILEQIARYSSVARL